MINLRLRNFEKFQFRTVLNDRGIYMETANSDRFLSSFNQIHDYIRRTLGVERHIGFTDGLNKLRAKNFILARYYDDLIVYNDLRNVIVHKKNKVNFVIAEPHDETVHKIEQIRDDLTNPEKVYPKFKTDVHSFYTAHSLSDVLKEVKTKGFSQFPVYEHGKFKGLITENGITIWLSNSLGEDFFIPSETKIKDIIGYEEKADNYLFVSRNISIFKAKELYLNHINRGSVKLDALLITEHGKPDETLLGIITPWDVIDI